MELSLTEEEVAALRAALDEVISDLSPEISHTDNARYRHLLEEHRAVLKSIRSQLEGALHA